MRTIGNLLDQSKGLGRGFDFLRVALSIGVVTWHTTPIATGSWAEGETRFLWIFDYSILEMFFGLSGFLIAGSALRLTLSNFLINRSLRIVPALAVEIVLSALIIGPFFTSLPLSAYYSDIGTYQYFTNIVGLINYILPGVFSDNPLHQVNASLWTIPFEIGCYVIMALFISFNVLKKPLLILIFATAILLAGLVVTAYGYRGHPEGVAQNVMDYLIFGRGSRLLVFFMLGIFSFLFRYRIPYSRTWCYFSIFYLFTLDAAIHKHYPFPVISLISAIPTLYIMLYIGVSKLPPMPLFRHGDYSYGIYLYGWPIMQAVRATLPIAQHPLLLWAFSMPLIILVSMLSWHFVEKPILRQRKKFSFVARQRLEEIVQDTGSTLATAERANSIAPPGL